MKKNTTSSMKVVACCIARTENRYLREWLDYHLSLGFDHIYLCDNAQGQEERLLDVVGQCPAYRDKVTVFPYFDKKGQQCRAYTDCYMCRNLDFDWMAFFDVDEFITFAVAPHTGQPVFRDVHDFLEARASDADEVLLNWMLYGDNGHVTDDGRPNLERFTRPLPYDFSPYNMAGKKPINCHVKQFLRAGLPVSVVMPHATPVLSASREPRVVDADGHAIVAEAIQPRYTFETAYVRHFITRSIQEYIRTKIGRGMGVVNANWKYNLGDFFLYNRLTFAKLRLYRVAARQYPDHHTHHSPKWWAKCIVKGYLATPLLGWLGRMK